MLYHGGTSVKRGKTIVFSRLNCSTDMIRLPDSAFFLCLWATWSSRTLLTHCPSDLIQLWMVVYYICPCKGMLLQFAASILIRIGQVCELQRKSGFCLQCEAEGVCYRRKVIHTCGLKLADQGPLGLESTFLIQSNRKMERERGNGRKRRRRMQGSFPSC